MHCAQCILAVFDSQLINLHSGSGDKKIVAAEYLAHMMQSLSICCIDRTEGYISGVLNEVGGQNAILGDHQVCLHPSIYDLLSVNKPVAECL
jgi:hypothetical protein